jgi:UDP-2-acetamido-3-amino-2,3-dideoxy-glucuronate N-acetyltransferase
MTKKITVVGGGRWGTNHIKTLINLDSFMGVVETNRETQNKLRDNFENINIYNNLSESFSDNPDGYTVATPPITHFDIASEIIHNLKPVLVEKPLTLDYNSSEKLVQLAHKKKVNLMVGHVLLFHPAIQKIKEIISNNKIGDIKYVYSNRLNLGTIRTDEDVFWSFAPHDISIFQYLIEDTPIDVTPFNYSYLIENINDISIVNFKYKNNIKAHIFTSWSNPFKEHKLVIIGSEGMIVFEDSSEDKNILFYDKYYNTSDDKSIKTIHNEPIIIDYERSMPLTNELDYFIQNLDKKINISGGESGLEVVKILEKV